MWLIRTALSKPYTFVVMALLIAIGGVLSALKAPTDIFPAIDIPVITVIGLQVGGLLAGAVITETVFAWNGVGRWVVDAIGDRDYFVIQSSILIFAIIFLIVNLSVDIGYAFLNPRIRYS